MIEISLCGECQNRQIIKYVQDDEGNFIGVEETPCPKCQEIAREMADNVEAKTITLKNGVEFVLINWEAGNHMIMKYPTLYLKSDDKDI